MVEVPLRWVAAQDGRFCVWQLWDLWSYATAAKVQRLRLRVGVRKREGSVVDTTFHMSTWLSNAVRFRIFCAMSTDPEEGKGEFVPLGEVQGGPPTDIVKFLEEKKDASSETKCFIRYCQCLCAAHHLLLMKVA